MENIYPITYMQNVIDEDTKENLYEYLSQYNYINIGYAASSIAARKAVRPVDRKKGLYITYYLEDEVITEYFIGNKTECSDDDIWSSDELWQPTTLTALIARIPRIDGEDITLVNNILKLADKPYSVTNHSGKGRKILRKNIGKITVGGKPVEVNILTQDMIDDEDTIYILQYNYNLNGATIKMPAGSAILLYGGEITNGTIRGNCSDIIGFGTVKVTLKGTWLTHGITSSRPDGNILPGHCYFDTTINKPIWWNGLNWVDCNGNQV